MANFKCSDTGMDCRFEFSNAASRDEALQLATTHAKVAHGMASIPPDLATKVNSAIKE